MSVEARTLVSLPLFDQLITLTLFPPQCISCVLTYQLTYTHRFMNIMTDKVFRAVIAANNQEAVNQGEGYKYHLVGGAAGTVSPSKCVLLLMILILHHHISSCSL